LIFVCLLGSWRAAVTTASSGLLTCQWVFFSLPLSLSLLVICAPIATTTTTGRGSHFEVPMVAQSPSRPVTQSSIIFILLNVPNSRQRKSLTFYGYDSEFIKIRFYIPNAVATSLHCNSSECHAYQSEMADTKSGQQA